MAKPRIMTNAEKRWAITELLQAEPDRADRSIANEIGVAHATVARVRKRLGIAPLREGSPHGNAASLVAPATGNQRALRHGAFATSGRMQARADELVAELRQVVPSATPADDVVLTLLARVLARIEVITAYVDEHGLFRGRSGEPAPILRHLTSSENTALRLCDQLGLTPASRARLGVARDGAAAYAKYLEITSGNGDSSDA